MKRFIFIFLFSLVFVPKISFASVIINEILFDAVGTDTGHEWVEIYNNGNSDVDLSGYKFVESGSNHSLVSTTGSFVSAGGYAIIADNPTTFKLDNSGYSGIVFDSTFSLSNSAPETLELKDASGSIVNSVTYNPPSTANEGGSFSLIDGNWEASNATPGQENSSGAGGGNNGNNGGGSSDTTEKEEKVEPFRQNLQIIANEITEPNTVTDFESKVTSNTGLNYLVGKYVWNFGDGNTETKINENKILHTYVYSGDYVVTLKYYERESDKLPLLEERFVLKVVSPQIVINSVGNDIDPFVELKNSSSYEVDLSGWSIIVGNKIFLIPEGTIVLSGKTFKLSPKVTGFTKSDLGNIKITFPNNEIEYSNQIIKKVYTNSTRENSNNINLGATPINSPQVLGAQINEMPVASDKIEKINNVNTKTKSVIWVWLLFAGLLLSGIIVSYLIYNKSSKTKDEKDFEIIE